MNHNTPRPQFVVLVALVLGLTLCVDSLHAADAERPNIVIILADDLGYGDVTFNPQHAADAGTPNIDRLAKDGVVMTNGYVTAPNCAPARAALMTGRYQQRFGLYSPSHSRAGIPTEEILLPAVIGKAGYTSGVFGKWHLGFAPEDNPVERGFDEFYGFLGHGGHDYFKLAAPPEGEPVYQAIRRGHDVIDDEGYLTRRITEEAIDFIQRHKDQPFFAYVAYNAPHSPLQAPEHYIKKHNTGDKDRDTYLAMVQIMDEGIGEIINALKAQDDYDNTLIFFLSDNGGARAVKANNAPLKGFKQLMHEGGLRVPFVVTWPAQLEAGTTSDVPVVCFDIFPTAAAIAGVDLPQDRPIDGKNLLPAVRQEVDQLHDAIFWSQPQNKREHWAVRVGDMKRLVNRGTPGLYNLSQDIGESSNLLASQPEKALELEARFRAWEAGMSAPLAEDLHHRRRAPLMIEYRDASFLEWRKQNGERW